MKTKILIIAFTIAVIASFSFITISKETLVKNNQVQSKHPEPMHGFTMEDPNQF